MPEHNSKQLTRGTERDLLKLAEYIAYSELDLGISQQTAKTPAPWEVQGSLVNSLIHYPTKEAGVFPKITTFTTMPSQEPQQMFCKSCEKRWFKFIHHSSVGCPLCHAHPSSVLSVFSIEYLNHVRLKHPEMGIRARLKVR